MICQGVDSGKCTTEAYNGSLESEPPVGSSSRGLVEGQGGKA